MYVGARSITANKKIDRIAETTKVIKENAPLPVFMNVLLRVVDVVIKCPHSHFYNHNRLYLTTLVRRRTQSHFVLKGALCPS